MEHFPLNISIIFLLTVALTILLFYKAAHRSVMTLFIISAWAIIQAGISLSGFYTITNALPPRFFLLVLPPLLLIAGLFLTKRGRQYSDRLNPAALTILHIIRIPVEVILYALYLNKKVPVLMTFEGRNFDILSGITAPVIFYFGFVKQRINKKILLTWNFICLGLLINIVVNAMLAAPFPFQQFGFDQPNVAILYFPFALLPGCAVPIVLLAHLTTIRQLLKPAEPNIVVNPIG